VFVALTRLPGTEAPDLSMTAPRSMPAPICPLAGIARAEPAMTANTKYDDLILDLIFSSFR
jgi:hypothetical protein